MCLLVFFFGVFSAMYLKYNSFKWTITNYDIFLNYLNQFLLSSFFKDLLLFHMDVSYLFWCSQEMLKRGEDKTINKWIEEFGAEMDDLKKELNERKYKEAQMEGTAALFGLHEGAIRVGEAFRLMCKEKDPDLIVDIPADVDAPKARAGKSRDKCSHPYGYNGTFDYEF